MRGYSNPEGFRGETQKIPENIQNHRNLVDMGVKWKLSLC